MIDGEWLHCNEKNLKKQSHKQLFKMKLISKPLIEISQNAV